MKVENVERRLLRVDEVAAVFDVNPETVRRLVHRGELLAVRLGRGPRAPIRVDSRELEKFITERNEHP